VALLVTYLSVKQKGWIMFATKWFMSTAIALGLAFGSLALVTEPHAHGDASAVQLRLDHGKKWRTADALRRGMNEIRAAMAESHAAIHRNRFTPAQYDAHPGKDFCLFRKMSG